MKILMTFSLILGFFSSISFAQFDILGKVKDKVEQKVEEETDAAIDDAVDEAADEVKGENYEEESTEENSEAASENEETKTAVEKKESLKSYSKYDFVPGENIIYYEDFSQDNIGDFPALWYTNKSGEVRTTNLFEGNWFQMREDGLFYLEKGLTLPENFTIEFDVIPVAEEDTDPGSVGFDFTILSTDDDGLFPTMYVPGAGGIVLNLATPNGYHSYSSYASGDYGVSGDYGKEKGLLKWNEVNHVSIWIQKTRFRVYLHGDKIFDIPKAITPGLKLNQFRFWTYEGSAPMFANFKVAEAGADTRSKLLIDGKIVTHGILFDINSDKIKPESYGTLKDIANVLKENSSIKVQIVGHTDSDGSDDSNLDLSKRRAASIKNVLESEFEIEASRMETDGKGESEPASDNNSPAGKANNRRVEFIKL